MTSALESIVVYEDDQLLVVNKPAGWNTHAPHPHANEGVYEWLRNRELRWASLAIIHRLDKETSGLMLFTKTPEANRSLTEQFTQRRVKKEYELWVSGKSGALAGGAKWTVKTMITRAGDRYVSGVVGEEAETEFEVLGEVNGQDGVVRLVARPKTGRTHQIRVHAASRGLPIWGDQLYGGERAGRVYLHARSLELIHPTTGETKRFEVLPEWGTAVQDARDEVEQGCSEICARQAIRRAVTLVRGDEGGGKSRTTAYRMVHGAGDGWPGWYVDRLGDWVLVQSEMEMGDGSLGVVRGLVESESRRAELGWEVKGIYYKRLTRHVRGAGTAEASPVKVWGEEAPVRFEVRENGVRYGLSFVEGYSVGLFLDQRENRRRWLLGQVTGVGGAGRVKMSGWFPKKSGGGEWGKPLVGYEVLNTFAYTCGFSVVAGLAGARVTSLDLAKKYLEWGKQNMERNGMDPAQHDFVFGDTMDWMKRWLKKGRTFDAIILDPPTFSQSKEHGRWQAEKDYDRLVEAAVRLWPREGGVVMASTNAARLEVDAFLGMVRAGLGRAGRKVVGEHYVAQPPDFPMVREEPGYFKSVWVAGA